jgi:hypothetical protein
MAEESSTGFSAEWSDVDGSLVSHPDEDQRYLSTETDWSDEFGTLCQQGNITLWQYQMA